MSKKTMKIRHALFMSVIAMILCCAMLVGTTFAWFTDEVTSTGNIIKSGSLDVEMSWANSLLPVDSNDWIDASTGAIFNYQYWEPGYTEVRYVKISNVGDLAFKYVLNILPSTTTAAGNFDIADVIDVYMVKPAVNVSRDDVSAATPVGTLSELIEDPDGAAYGILLPKTGSTNITLDPADVNISASGDVIVAIVLKMQETAGNDYQNISVGGDFKVQLLATQYTYEKDSFDNQYDKDAE